MDDDWDIDESPKPSGTSTPAVPAAPPKVAARKKWDDEDAEEEEDDWDASEDEKPKAATPAAAPGPVRKKKLKEKMAEKERLAREGPGEDVDIIDGRTEQDRRREAREREMEADLAAAADLMGSTTVEDAGEILKRIAAARPKTKEEFDGFGKDLIAAFVAPYANEPAFPLFVESFAKDLCETLTAIQVRKVSSGLSTLGNTKQQEEKDKASGKKKGSAKPKLGVGKTAAAKSADLEAYDDDVLDDDDFM